MHRWTDSTNGRVCEFSHGSPHIHACVITWWLFLYGCTYGCMGAWVYVWQQSQRNHKLQSLFSWKKIECVISALLHNGKACQCFVPNYANHQIHVCWYLLIILNIIGNIDDILYDPILWLWSFQTYELLSNCQTCHSANKTNREFQDYTLLFWPCGLVCHFLLKIRDRWLVCDVIYNLCFGSVMV